MKKFLKYSGISIFIVLFILITAELLLIYKSYNLNIFNPTYFYEPQFRKSALYENTNKKSVILMGCSFFQDIFLKDEDLAQPLMSKLTKRNVYNLGLSGGSPIEVLYILRNFDKDPTIINIFNGDKNIEHIIYNYMFWHLNSLYFCTHPGACIRYKNENNKLVLYNNPIKNLFIMRAIEDELAWKIRITNFDKAFDLFVLYMAEIRKTINEQFGKDTQFTVLVVKDKGTEPWDKVEKLGINVININEILGFNVSSREYAISDTNGHPNKKAWEVIVPALVKELNL